MSNLVSYDYTASTAEALNRAVAGWRANYGANRVRIAKATVTPGGAVSANIDFLLKKGNNLPNSFGMKFNSARRYRYNDNTFASKGKKLRTKTCVEFV